MGIDEAGRGPLLSSLVMCACVIDEDNVIKLRNLGVKDSKQLTPKAREKLAKVLPHFVSYSLEIISPQEIDFAVLSESTNLNWLEADHTVKLIQSLAADKVVVDCPSPNITTYSQYIKKQLNGLNINLVAEHKADVNYPIVAAASILAKVERDRIISELKIKLGIDFGSGYPSDPKTKSFLREYWRQYPEVFRKSWAPYQKVAGNN